MDGCYEWRAKIMYRSVKWFGGRSYNAHFLSDVLLAALFCFIITLAMHQVIFFQPDNARKSS